MIICENNDLFMELKNDILYCDIKTIIINKEFYMGIDNTYKAYSVSNKKFTLLLNITNINKIPSYTNVNILYNYFKNNYINTNKTIYGTIIIAKNSSLVKLVKFILSIYNSARPVRITDSMDDIDKINNEFVSLSEQEYKKENNEFVSLTEQEYNNKIS